MKKILLTIGTLATLIVSCKNVKIIYSLSVNPTSISFAANETTTKTVTVTTDASNWETNNSASWLTIAKQGAILQITSTTNTSTSERSAKITVTAATAPAVTISVIQAGVNTLSINPNSISFAANETITKTATVTSNATNWDATTTVEWLTIGKQGTTLQLTPTANTQPIERSTTVTVTAGTAVPVTVTVTQAAAPTTLTINPTSISFTDDETTARTITIVTNAVNWDVTTTSTWLSISKQGNSFTITPTENIGTSLRSATVTVTAGDQSKQVTVEQSAGSTEFGNGIVAASSFGGGNGTESNPYLINNAKQLKKLVDDVNGGHNYANTCFKLIVDIEVTADEWIPIGNEWIPIGSDNYVTITFNGKFDGNNRTINGTLKSARYNCFAFFGYLDNYATISNLTIAATVINYGYFSPSIVSAYTGSIVGWSRNQNVLINKCSASGTVTGGDGSSVTGGILGGGSARILNCEVASQIIGGNKEASITGGIVGNLFDGGEITGCYALTPTTINGGESSNTNTTGGIAGMNHGVISFCTNQANVNGGKSINYYSCSAGIVGVNNSRVADCVNQGNIEGNAIPGKSYYIGGIAGLNNKGNRIGLIINCTNSGTVSGDGSTNTLSEIGGIVGINNSNIINCTNNANVTGGKYNGGLTARNSGEIHTSLNTGNVSGFGLADGGLAGDNSTNNDSHIYSCCTNRGTVNGQSANTNNQIGTSISKPVETCPDGHTKR